MFGVYRRILGESRGFWICFVEGRDFRGDCRFELFIFEAYSFVFRLLRLYIYRVFRYLEDFGVLSSSGFLRNYNRELGFIREGDVGGLRRVF